jgi:predicted phage replisome organizer
MAEVKWIKIVTDIFDDEKIMLIESLPEADSIIVIWFKLLCLAGKQNNSGVFQINGRIPYTDEMFATIFRRPLNTVKLALKTFETYGMIEIINDTVTIPNWGKHQSIEQIEARREYQRKYHQEYRRKQKLLTEGEPVDDKDLRKCLRQQDVNTPDKIREDKNRSDKNREEEPKRKRFTAPTVEEVSAYALEKGYEGFSAERFVDYYASKGWVVGKSPMKDWKAAVRNWAARDKGETKQQGRPEGWHNPALDYAQRDYTGTKPKTPVKVMNIETGEWEVLP